MRRVLNTDCTDYTDILLRDVKTGSFGPIVRELTNLSVKSVLSVFNKKTFIRGQTQTSLSVKSVLSVFNKKTFIRGLIHTQDYP